MPLRGDYEEAANEVLRITQPTVKPLEAGESALEVRATTDGDIPIQGATVCALAENGTTIDAATGPDGGALLQLRESGAYTILVAHPEHPARLVDNFRVGLRVDVRLPFHSDIGSLIIHSTGYIPGLNGRLNPIRDTLNRTYLYADNIAVNGGQAQPTSFAVNEPFELEDAIGSRFEVSVKLIAGRTSLLEYRRLD